MARVLLMVIDGCTSRVFGPALEAGELPLFGRLAAAGHLRLDCISIFPSITPAATASIITGRYPAQHGIAGMSWWHPDSGQISYFGDDIWTISQRGLGDFLEGFLLKLNGERLRAPTLFEIVERRDAYAACFNYLIFRGERAHEVSMPLLLALIPGVARTITVRGPSWLCLGDFISATGRGTHLDTTGGPFNRFGLNDAGTCAFLHSLTSVEQLPEFTVAYFPDYDFDSHKRGPKDALSTLRTLDKSLGDLFAHWGGLDRVLEHTRLVITADHAHSDVRGDDDAAIRLEDVLTGFRCGDPAAGWQSGDDLLLCPNMRAAEVYLRDVRETTIRRVADALMTDARIDQVIWRIPQEHDDDFHVASADRGSLIFRRAAAGTGAARDEYGGVWHVEGELEAVDAAIDGDRIRYGAYPNALERIAGGVEHPRSGRLWVTARPGCEFRMTGQDVHHRGGSHGTLHELDSLVPLLVTGPSTPLPEGTPRIVDVASVCAALLGIPFDIAPGASHG